MLYVRIQYADADAVSKISIARSLTVQPNEWRSRPG